MMSRKNINIVFYKAEPDKDTTVANFTIVQKITVRDFRTVQMIMVGAFFAPTTQWKAVKGKMI